MRAPGKSQEDYLEAIYCLRQRFGEVRSVMVARYLGNSKPSVTKAVERLQRNGYLYKEKVFLCLTEEGEEIGRKIHVRHSFFKSLLMEAGVPEETADREACGLEHVLSEDSYQRLKGHIRLKS